MATHKDVVQRLKAADPDHFKKIGAMGGAVRHPGKGFGSNRQLASIVGAKGGHISRRVKRRRV